SDEAFAPADTAGELGREPLRNVILDDDLNQWVARLKDRKLMVFVDACHAGTITRALSSAIPARGKYRVRTLTPRGPVTRGIQLSLSDAVRARHKVSTRLLEIVADPQGESEPVVWTATASAQLALDSASGGVFTQSFLDGLADKKADSNGDGEVTVAEILRYVREVSESECLANSFLCRSGLTPTLEASDAYYGEVLFPYDATDKAPQKLAVAEKAESYFAHNNDFGLSVEILPGPHPKLGSEVKFRVKSDSEGYLILFDEGPDGAFRQIFPNSYARMHGKRGLIRAHAPLTIPDAYYGFAFTADTKGPGTLIALVVEDAARLETIVSQHLDFSALKDPDKLLAALARELYRPLETEEDDKPNRRLKWAYKAVKYVVE
ncbi:MAG: DUF4384 domain-containing protein, partial [Proteobacteria bacterium]|nr:DUF4384 domain-containing protein [Pseudomonadota bacterium]